MRLSEAWSCNLREYERKLFCNLSCIWKSLLSLCAYLVLVKCLIALLKYCKSIYFKLVNVVSRQVHSSVGLYFRARFLCNLDCRNFYANHLYVLFK